MKKLFSIFLSLLVLLSSIGFTYSTHLCMGRVVESKITTGIVDLSCGMEETGAFCDGNSESEGIMAPGCCENEHITFEIGDDYQKVSYDMSFQLQFLLSFTYAFIIHPQNKQTQFFAYNDLHPPPLIHDLSMYQSYRL